MDHRRRRKRKRRKNPCPEMDLPLKDSVQLSSATGFITSRSQMPSQYARTQRFTSTVSSWVCCFYSPDSDAPDPFRPRSVSIGNSPFCWNILDSRGRLWRHGDIKACPQQPTEFSRVTHSQYIALLLRDHNSTPCTYKCFRGGGVGVAVRWLSG